MEQPELDVAYWEIHGRLEKGSARPLGRDVVVLSNIDQGMEASPAARGLSVRYVARGCENYRIGGRGYRLEAGQVMIAPHEGGAECEVRRVDRSGTLGVCTLVRGASDALDWVYGPLVVGADCTSIGPLLRQTAKALASGGGAKNQIAHQLIGGLRSELPAVAQAVLAQAAAVAGTKPATRFEMVRRANLAQAYLHATTDHAVDLDELAAVVGISPFRLLAAFQHCFGESPASYHRKLRLRLVIEEAARRDMPLSAVAEQFGFAGVSSFSHTYRRVFGRAPVWSKGEPS